MRSSATADTPEMRRILLLTACVACASACASTGGVPRPFPTPGRSPPPITASPLPETRAGIDGYAVTGTALSLRGTPYRNGGADPQGFDCSGFTQYVFAQYGVPLARDVRDQFEQGKSVKSSELAVGDLLFFTTVAISPSRPPAPTHVGIAIGGNQFVHAPSSTGVVR